MNSLTRANAICSDSCVCIYINKYIIIRGIIFSSYYRNRKFPIINFI